MDRLPPEILHDIFPRSLPSMRRMRLRQYFSLSITAPLYISHVCRRWREVSLSCGALWSYLCVSYDGSGGPRRRKSMIDVFDAWLRRTNNAPLNFFIICKLGGNHDREADRAAEYVLTTMLLEQRRWKDVSFAFTNVRVSDNFKGINVTYVPLLVSLHFIAEILIDYSYRRQPCVLNVAQSPKLRDLYLWGTPILEYGESSRIPLTRVRMSNHYAAEEAKRVALMCLDLLKAAPCLVHCDIYNANDYDAWDSWAWENYLSDDRPPIVHNMEHLILSSDCAYPSIIILSKLTLPTLKVLNYDAEPINEAEPVLLDFIRRSSPPLQRLEILAVDSALIPVLRLLPTLRYLTINTCQKASWLYYELSRSADGQITCPSLRSLTLDEVSTIDPNEPEECVDALYAMLEYRWKCFGTFESVELNTEKKMRMPSFRQYRDELIHRLTIYGYNRLSIKSNPDNDTVSEMDSEADNNTDSETDDGADGDVNSDTNSN